MPPFSIPTSNYNHQARITGTPQPHCQGQLKAVSLLKIGAAL